MINGKPEVSIEKSMETIAMLKRVFPYSRTEGLKIYALLSIKTSLMPLVTHETAEVMIFGAYSLDDAVRENTQLMVEKHPKDYGEWMSPRLIASQPFEQAVPIAEIGGMVESIKRDMEPDPASILTLETDKLINCARYLFDKANATSYEKGILTGIINRINKQDEPI